MLTADVLKSILDAKSVPQLTPDRHLSRVRFSSCGRFLLAAGRDGLVHRWDLSGESPAKLTPITGHHGWVQTLACRPDGDLVVTADSWGRLQCTPYAGDDIAPRWAVDVAHDGWILDLALSPDGTTLATSGQDRVIRLWNASTGERLRELTGHATEVFSTVFSADSATLFSGDLEGHVYQWNVADGSRVGDFDATPLHTSSRLQEVGGARTLAVSRPNNTLLVAGTKPKNGGNVQGDPTILVFDIATGELKSTFTLGAAGDVYVTDLVELPDGDWLATISGNPGTGKVVAFRLDADQPLYETRKYPNCHSIAWHPTTRRLAVSATNTGSNGNGRPLKDGEYRGNFSPISLFTLPDPSST